MVGQWPPPGLCSFSPERRRSADVKTIRELRISVTKQDERGWMSENYPSLQPREKCFLLTSPFIEPGLCQMGISVVCDTWFPEVFSCYLSKWAARVLDFIRSLNQVILIGAFV